MATIVQKGGGGLLGTLGGLATIGGALIPGAGWLTPLGTALGTANSMMNGGGTGGQGGQQGGGLLDAIGQILGGWKNPASGNIASQTPDLPRTDNQLMNEWGHNPYAGYIYGGGNLWQR